MSNTAILIRWNCNGPVQNKISQNTTVYKWQTSYNFNMKMQRTITLMDYFRILFFTSLSVMSFEQVQNLCLTSSCTGNIINNFSIFTRTLLNAKKILLVELPITITLRVLADKVLTFYLRDLSHTYMLFLAMCFYQIK